MPGQDVNQLLTVSRTLPTPQTDGKIPVGNPRAGRYSEQYALSLVPTKHLLADEGSYFTATNPTPGTAFAYAIQAAFADTAPFLYMFNKDTANGKRVWLDYIKLIVTIAAATGTQAYFAIVLDNVARAFSVDNAGALSLVSPNSDLSPSSVTLLKVQNSATASVLAASSQNKRVVARGSFGGITIPGDELVILCGAPDPGPYAGLTAAQAVCPGRKVSTTPPIIIGPQTSATVHLWFPGNATTGLSFEFELGVVER